MTYFLDDGCSELVTSTQLSGEGTCTNVDTGTGIGSFICVPNDVCDTSVRVKNIVKKLTYIDFVAERHSLDDYMNPENKQKSRTMHIPPVSVINIYAFWLSPSPSDHYHLERKLSLYCNSERFRGFTVFGFQTSDLIGNTLSIEGALYSINIQALAFKWCRCVCFGVDGRTTLVGTTCLFAKLYAENTLRGGYLP